MHLPNRKVEEMLVLGTNWNVLEGIFDVDRGK